MGTATYNVIALEEMNMNCPACSFAGVFFVEGDAEIQSQIQMPCVGNSLPFVSGVLSEGRCCPGSPLGALTTDTAGA